ncbi:sulfotransferase family protein [Sodalinema gerasimenkoae]|uniref:sulfotransferase family protein n=1 Tax=Sodalinema gerasimenkoae TaxID=2862348 RepID=UPI0013598B5B|nr:sulfotransferase [Sodalinema gerasimenkoae]
MNSPHFIVVGAHKSGTSSLHTYLNQHPEICLPPKKGLDLLSRRNFKELEEAREYLSQFEEAESGQVLGEVSSVYLHGGQKFVEKLKHLFPEIKIIAILRNPIERAYSHALWDHRNHAYTQDELDNLDQYFHQSIMTSTKFLIPGQYHTHLQTYLSHFDRGQIKLFRHEDFIKNSDDFFAEIFDFVGVDPTFHPDMSSRLHVGSVQLSNPYRTLLKQGESMRSVVKLFMPKAMRQFIRDKLYAKSYAPKPLMSKDLRLELINYFHDEVIHLQELTGLEVSHWLKMPESESASGS